MEMAPAASVAGFEKKVTSASDFGNPGGSETAKSKESAGGGSDEAKSNVWTAPELIEHKKDSSV